MKGNLLLFYLFFSITCTVSAGNDRDSLTQIYNNAQSNSEKIEALSDLVCLALDKPEEVGLLQELEKLALQEGNEQLCGSVYYALSRHYYNKSLPDSLIYWADKGKKFVRKHELYDIYFRIQNLVCLMYYIDYKWDTAMDKAIEMRDEAKQLENSTGQAMGIEVIGLIYTGLGNFDEANKLFLEGLELDGQISPLVRLDLLVDLLLNAYRREDFSMAEGYLAEARMLLHEIDNSSLLLNGMMNKQLRETELDCYQAYLYAHLNKTDDARKYLFKVDSMFAYIDHPYIDYYFHLASSFYYKSLGKYSEALVSINNALNVDKDPSVIVEKGNIYSLLGDYKKAAELYKQSYQIADSITNVSAADRVSRMNIRHEMNSLAVYTKELEIERREKIITIGIFFLAVLLLLLISLSLFLIHTRRLKSKLEKSEQTLLKEKEALIEAHEKLNKAREEAETAREEAIKASKTKSAFLANMSHEIRTPLNSIVGFADVLSASLKGDDITYITIMKKNAYLLLNLMNDILDLSRCDSGKMQFNFVTFDVLNSCRNVMANVLPLLNKDVKIKIDSELESLLLYTDPIRFQQVITNLMTNAVKFTKEGQIILSVEVDKKKKVAKFVVTDTGCGIPPEQQEKIFERFEKLNEYSQGTGLGLAICRVISENLGGCVELDSTYTGGARFVFTHPLP